MTVEYITAAKNNRLAAALIATPTSPVTPAVGQSVDGNTGDGLLVIGTSALNGAVGVLCTVSLAKPSFSIANGVATLLGVPLQGSVVANGTAALAELRDSAGNTIVSGLTVGVSGTDIILTVVGLVAGMIVQITAGTITQP